MLLYVLQLFNLGIDRVILLKRGANDGIGYPGDGD